MPRRRRCHVQHRNHGAADRRSRAAQSDHRAVDQARIDETTDAVHRRIGVSVGKEDRPSLRVEEPLVIRQGATMLLLEHCQHGCGVGQHRPEGDRPVQHHGHPQHGQDDDHGVRSRIVVGVFGDPGRRRVVRDDVGLRHPFTLAVGGGDRQRLSRRRPPAAPRRACRSSRTRPARRRCHRVRRSVAAPPSHRRHR